MFSEIEPVGTDSSDVAESPPVVSTSRKHGLRGRLWLLVAGLMCGWLIVCVRLVTLYYSDGATLQQRVVQQQTTTQVVRARPGDILDRQGRLLATSIDTHSLYCVPKAIEDPAKFADAVAALVDVDSRELADRISERSDKGFLWVVRRLDHSVAEKVRQLDLPTETYGFEREYRRHYPQGSVAVHLLGLRDIDGIGRGGLEQGFDAHIKGRNGQRVLVRDARNRVVHLYEPDDQQVIPGRTLTTTLDIRMQRVVERELKQIQTQWQPTGCCAILMQPQTGELLALASQPDFHPQQPETFRDAAWMNRAIAWTYEPGSTIKPLIVAWALQQQKVSPRSMFYGHGGAYRMGRRILHDTHPHGDMTLADVLIGSSNIGMAQIGERLTNAGLAAGLDRFGYGFRTGVGLPGELPGFVRPLPEWTDYSTGSIPMGQELMVTPLQMIVAHATLANGGYYRQPKLVVSTTTDTVTAGSRIETPVIDPAICQWVITDPMRRVLTEGTGRRVNVAGMPLFGKTGTSQIYDAELGRYSNQRTVCSFVCGLPADKPELIVIVVVDEPTVGTSHFGSNVAAPAAVQILLECNSLSKHRLATGQIKPIR